MECAGYVQGVCYGWVGVAGDGALCPRVAHSHVLS